MKGFLARTGKRLTRKLGPLPVWVWAALAVGALVYRQRKKYGSAGTSSTTTGSGSGAGSGSGDYWGGGGSSGSGGGTGGDTGTGSGTGTGTNPGGPERGGKPPAHHRKPPKHHKKPPKPKKHRHKHVRAHGGAHGPVGAGGRVTPHTSSGFRTAPASVGRTTMLRAAPLTEPTAPRPAPATGAHAVPPSRPTASVQSARHTAGRSAPAPAAPPRGGGGIVGRIRRGKK